MFWLEHLTKLCAQWALKIPWSHRLSTNSVWDSCPYNCSCWESSLCLISSHLITLRQYFTGVVCCFCIRRCSPLRCIASYSVLLSGHWRLMASMLPEQIWIYKKKKSKAPCLLLNTPGVYLSTGLHYRPSRYSHLTLLWCYFIFSSSFSQNSFLDILLRDCTQQFPPLHIKIVSCVQLHRNHWCQNRGKAYRHTI